MRTTQALPRLVRIKKLSRQSGQTILREDQLDSAEYSSLQANYNVETGVEKSEEKVSRDNLKHDIIM
jgi:enhancer of polycomb-like protein